LALTGSRAEIHRYLDQVRRDHGRTAELVSADRISAEKNGRELARLVAADRIINHADPSGPGSVDEHVRVLRRMASDISENGDLDYEPTLAVHQRFLVEFDPDLDPPAVKLTTVAGVREVFTRMIDSFSHRDAWAFYAQTPDLRYFGHEGMDIPVPNWDPIRMEAVSDEAIRQALAARRWPGVATVADLLASLREDTQEPAQAALMSPLVEKLAAVALEAGGRWTGTKGRLCELTGHVSTQVLTAELGQLAAELAIRGVTVSKTGHRLPPARSWEWAVEVANRSSTSSTSSIAGQDADDVPDDLG
jgi:hypothetical protein